MITYNANENHSRLCDTEFVMAFLFFFVSLVSVVAVAEAVRRRRGLREAAKVGAVLFAALSAGGAALTGTDAAVGCAAAVCVLSVGTLLELAHRVPAEAVWLTASLSVGLGAAAPIFAIAVLTAVLLRNSAELLLQRFVGRWERSVQAREQGWRMQPAVMCN